MSTKFGEFETTTHDIGVLETLKSANESLRKENVKLVAKLKKYMVPVELGGYLAPSYNELLQRNKELQEDLKKYKKEELLPCPFCGSSALLRYESDKHHWVKCSECVIIQNLSYETMDDAREAWNTRVK